MKLKQNLSTLALALAFAASLPAHAHRAFLLPSATLVAGNSPWVTLDAAVASDVFFFDHTALKLDGLQLLAPDGSSAQPENTGSGKFRSSFDLRMSLPGTYQISLVTDNLMASYKDQGVTKRWRGSAQALATEIPATAEELLVTQNQTRIETFVSNGKPSAPKITGKGLELAAITHPNDLVVGESSSFRLLLDGKAAAGVKITLIAGGIRYRQKLGEQTFTSDAEGKFSIQWQQAGMVWLTASLKDNHSSQPAAKERRASYVATLEVLPQ